MDHLTTDEIARAAARLLHTGRVSGIGAAIRAAAERCPDQGVRRPAHGLVRKHLQGLAMQELGAEGYQETILDAWHVAEAIMTVLADDEPLFVGRAVRGQIDGGATLYIRLHTTRSMGEIAEQLVELGCEEPAFETVNTSHGRLNRLLFTEEGWDMVITRCPAAMMGEPIRDLIRGVPLPSRTLAALRQAMASSMP